MYITWNFEPFFPFLSLPLSTMSVPDTPISPIATTKNGDAAPNLMPPCIPPQHPYRTLVVCFDGTGDQYVLPPPPQVKPSSNHFTGSIRT